MNKKDKVKHLNRNVGHRSALIKNMAISFFKYEQIKSTNAKIKVLQSHVEKLITRAKKNLTENKIEKKLHNKRLIISKLQDQKTVKKLFEDIAVRYADHNTGGYTRVYKLVNRISDNSQMAILELTKKKSKEELKVIPVKAVKVEKPKVSDKKEKVTKKK